MLSILIPIYNFDVRMLVKRLHEQGNTLSIPFEIIAVEDASKEQFTQLNQELLDLEHFNYEVLRQNIGRSKIRNYLATKAQYEYLLFMDCDSMPVNNLYLKNYAAHLAPQTLLYGGRCYQEKPPVQELLQFHWHYGKQREESKASDRQKSPYTSFMTNNFLVPKAVFFSIKFDENLTQYGHEDTLFGLELKKQSIFIQHLDNPLEHIGLEENLIFIKKSEQAIQNLHYLYSKGLIKNEVKLLRFYIYTKISFLHPIILFIFKRLKNKLLKKILPPSSNLRFFDFYKLAYLIAWSRKQT